MDALKRSLIEKTGHDFGFEYTVAEMPSSHVLGSAKHPLQVEISLSESGYKVAMIDAKPLLLVELERLFKISNNSVVCSSIQDLAAVLKRTAALARSLPNQAEYDFESAVEQELKKYPEVIKNSEVERMIRQRVGQDTYRKALLEYWGGACAVTGVALPEVLRASHALPWADCDADAQRLDVFNGFLLTANLDALFDRFLISFDRAGGLLISEVIAETDRVVLGLHSDLHLRWITDQHEDYLGLHRRRLLAK